MQSSQLELDQHCSNKGLPTYWTGTSVKNLRAFIAKNAVQPLKDSTGTTRDDLSSYLGKTLIEQLGSSLILRSSGRKDSQSSAKKKQRRTNDEVFLVSELICSFFEIAISWTSRDVPKARKDGDLFLQKLFDELKDVVTFHLGPDASDSRPTAYSKAVKGLLKQAVENDIRLSTASIESVLRKVSGLFSEDENEIIEWETVSLCLRNNFYIVLNRQNAISGLSANRKGNEVLRMIVAKVDRSQNKKGSSDYNQSYSLRVHGVLIPLMGSLANVRDLSGFFEIWRLRLAESVNPNVWIDDDLLSSARGLIEANMSSVQISTILEKIESHFERLDWSEKEAITLSNLVILECIVGGHYGEDLLSRLSQRIRSVYSTLATSLLKSSHSYGSLRWRVWRILTSVNQQWLNSGVFLIPNICPQLTETAFQMIDAPKFEIDNKDVYSCREKSFAFSYMASLSPFHMISDQWARDYRDLFNKSLNIVLDLNTVLCQQLDGDLFRVIKPLNTRHNWSGKAVAIESHDDLYLSCIAGLLLQSTAVQYTERTTQKRMLQQLSLLARHEQYMKESSAPGVNYSWLWHRAQRCQAINDHPHFAEELRLRQSQDFIHSIGSVDTLRQFNTDKEHESALESLLNSSLSKFSAGDMIEIANSTIEILRRRKGKPNSIATHLQILVKFAGASRKTCKRMRLFQNIQLDNDRLQERAAVFVLAEIVGQDLGSGEDQACDDALCDLTRIVVRCVAQLFTTGLTFLIC